MTKQIDIQVNHRGLGKIVINGKDLSDSVQSIKFECEAGKTPKVIIGLSPRAEVIISADCDVKVIGGR